MRRGEQNLFTDGRKIVVGSLPRNFSWLRVNQVAGCSAPKSETELRALVNIGIKHLVTLSTDSPPPQCVHAIQGLHWTTIPVKEFDGLKVVQILKFINICEKKEPVAVHCRMGRGRTGSMLAAYLMNYELKSAPQAIQEVRAARPGSVETKHQEEALQIWAKYLEDQQAEAQKEENFQDFLAMAPDDTL